MSTAISRQPFAVQPKDPAWGRLQGMLAPYVTDGLSGRPFSAGQLLFVEGEYPPGFWILGHGRVRLFKQAGDGREQTICVAAGPGCIGCPLFLGGRQPASAQAIDDGMLYFVLGSTIGPVTETEAFGQALLDLLVARRQTLLTSLGTLTLPKAAARIAKFLLDESAEHGPLIGLTHEQIGDRTAVAREVVSRTLSKWCREGVVKTGRGTLTICAAPILRHLVETARDPDPLCRPDQRRRPSVSSSVTILADDSVIPSGVPGVGHQALRANECLEVESLAAVTLVETGRVALWRTDWTGTWLVGHIRPGEIVAGAWPEPDAGAFYTAQALEPSTLAVLPARCAAHDHKTEQQVLHVETEGLSRHLTALLSRIETLAFRTVPERIAAFLLAETAGPVPSPGWPRTVSLRDLSDLLASRPEVVSRALGELDRRRLIRAGLAQITILDRQALTELAAA